MVNYGYLSNGSPVQDRLLINLSDDSYNIPLGLACVEASRLVDLFLTPYETTLPLTSPDTMIQMVTADFAASIFKRRQYPSEQSMKPALQPDMVNDVDGTGWFAVGLKRLQDYIKVKYALAVVIGNTVYNSDIYDKLYKDGLITLKEARLYMHLATVVAKNIENNEVINRAFNEAIAQAVTKVTYITSKKHSFAFISSDGNGGYTLDSEVE
jgi:hypothetical protein